MAKNLPTNAGDIRDTSLIHGWGRSPGKAWQPTPVFLPGKSHGQRSLVDYSSWGCKSPDRLREETTTTTTTSFLKRGFPVTWSFSALASFLFLPFPAFQHRAERGALVPNCSPEGPALPSLGSASSAQFLFLIPPVSQAAPVRNCEALVNIFSFFVSFLCPKPSSSILKGFLHDESHMAPCPLP